MPCSDLAAALLLGARSRPWQIRALAMDDFAAPVAAGLAWATA